jgi:hypothetical protein
MAQVQSQIEAGTAHPYTGFVGVNRNLGETLNGIARAWGLTRAWPVGGGVAAWRQHARMTDPGWLDRVEADRAPR